MKRVLVTGATGFIGRHSIAPLIERGYEVHAVGRGSLIQPGAIMHRADLFDQVQTGQLMQRVKPSHLLHFAWYAEHGKFWNSPLNVPWVAASINLLEWFSRVGGKRAVMAGTCAEYAPHPVPLLEAIHIQPTTIYGYCKNALRQVGEAWAASHKVEFAWGRIFHLYGLGEHQDRFVPSVIRSLLLNREAKCTAGNQVRDFLHVSDVASAFVAMLDSPVQGPVNIGSGVAITLGEVAQQIAEIIGKPELLKLGALPTNPNDPTVLIPDLWKLRETVDWKPSLSLDEGLRQTIEQWRADPLLEAA